MCGSGALLLNFLPLMLHLMAMECESERKLGMLLNSLSNPRFSEFIFFQSLWLSKCALGVILYQVFLDPVARLENV